MCLRQRDVKFNFSLASDRVRSRLSVLTCCVVGSKHRAFFEKIFSTLVDPGQTSVLNSFLFFFSLELLPLLLCLDV